MEKKLRYLLILIIVSFSMFLSSPVVRADYSVDYLYVEKTHYFIDEDMYFNFSAFNDHDPNPPLVDSFFQIHVDYSEGGEPRLATPIWASPEYREVGFVRHKFTISLTDLNLTIDQDENQTTIYIKLRYYNFDYFHPENEMDVYLSSYTKQVNVSKRGTGCFTLNALQMDRDEYYFKNSMRINTSFSLNYTVKPGENHAKIQYRILNISDAILWNSAWYNKSKPQLDFHVNLSNLHLSITEPRHFLKIFINYSFHVNDTGSIYMEQYTIPFNISTDPLDNIKMSYLYVETPSYYYGEPVRFGFSYEIYDNCNVHFSFSVNVSNKGTILWNSSKYSDIRKNIQFSIYSHEILLHMEENQEIFSISFFFHFNHSEAIYLVNTTNFILLKSNISCTLNYNSTLEYFQNQIIDLNLSNLYNASLPLFGNCTFKVQNSEIVKEVNDNRVNFTLFYQNLSVGVNMVTFKIHCDNHKQMIINRTITLIKLKASNLSIEIHHDSTMEIFQSQEILLTLKHAKEPSRQLTGNVSLSIIREGKNETSKFSKSLINNEVVFPISHDNLSIGINNLIFIIECEGFEEVQIEKIIELSKLNVTMMVNLTITEEWIKGTALFKYKQHEIFHELKNGKIILILIANNSVINKTIYTTNESGIISFFQEIPPDIITLIIEYRGNDYLTRIQKEFMIDNRKEILLVEQYPFLGFSSIIALVGLIMGYVIYKNKDKGQVDLEKYIFRK